MPKIVSIVEGDAERAAVPLLIRRIATEIGIYDVDGFSTVLTKRNRFPRMGGEREIRVSEARRVAGQDGAVLVVLDSDGEPPCVDPRHRLSPCILGADLSSLVTSMAGDLPTAVVMADREFEAWFVAAADSLVGPRGLTSGATSPGDPDRIRDAKGWLNDRMATDEKYRPTTDQARFTERFDMAMARERSPSFGRAYEEIARLVQAVSHHQASC